MAWRGRTRAASCTRGGCGAGSSGCCDPVLVYVAGMAVFAAVMTLFVGPHLDPLLAILNEPLWFLGVYTVTLLFLPFMWWVHQRNRAVAFVVLLPLAVLDSVGVTVLGWPKWTGFLNYVLCWLVIQQLGFFWGESTRHRTWVVVAASRSASTSRWSTSGRGP